ncbi:IS21-like element helper ATPase IstB [Dethiobacter alkaliphilus]|uniref:IS21-like element helper ATPase IstB n=1 Tax=Dethiobacter alkaliphilus TaxID=427926 RepID=UPI00222796E1|nr:IS21-like element helper ATPase IstB [Dethiobacter alkaliphilus]MCW3491685.1 IS21-like element helper ATPase IstB [Dethiobacter alkaliphilus]
MITQTLKEAFEVLNLPHMAAVYDHHAEEASRDSISYLEFLDKLLWAEIEAKKARATSTNLKLAKLPYVKTLDSFDFEFQPSANQRKVNELKTLAFVERSENVVFLGPPGVGKTHLAVGLAVEAIRNGHTAYFLSAHELISMIRENIESGRIHRKLKALNKPGILIIDEVGYAAMEDEVANYFFQIVSNRYEKGSIILTSNKSYGSWGDVFGNNVVATAILDRLLHHSTTINIKGDSYRIKEKKKAGFYDVSRYETDSNDLNG